MNEQRTDCEIEALKIKALVTVMSAIDSDNKQALQEMPIVASIASEMAERLYCAIADARAQEVR